MAKNSQPLMCQSVKCLGSDLLHCFNTTTQKAGQHVR